MKLNMSQQNKQVSFRNIQYVQVPKEEFLKPENLIMVDNQFKFSHNIEIQKLIKEEFQEIKKNSKKKFFDFLTDKITLRKLQEKYRWAGFLEQPCYIDIWHAAKLKNCDLNWAGQHLGMNLDPVHSKYHSFVVLTEEDLHNFKKAINSSEVRLQIQKIKKEASDKTKHSDPQECDLWKAAELNKLYLQLFNKVYIEHNLRKIIEHLLRKTR